MRFLKTHQKRYPAFLFTESKMQFALLDGEGTAFVAFTEKQIPANVIVNDEVVNPEALALLIKGIKDQFKITQKEVIVGVSEVKATTRSLTLPELKPEEISQAIEQEAASFLPFPYHEEYLDWMLIKKLPDETEKILISAIPKSMIDGYIKAFQLAGLAPVAFESTSISLFRLLPPEATESCLAVEIGELTTLLILGFEGTIEASSVIQESAGLEDKIEKLIYYYSQKKTGGKVPSTVYISGKHATAEIASQLQTRLNLKPVFLKSSVKNITPAQQLGYAVLSSLAAKQVHLPADSRSINVLPELLAHEYEHEKRSHLISTAQYIHVALVTLMTVIVAVLCVYTYNQRKLLDSELATVPEAQLYTFSPVRAGVMVKATRTNTKLRNTLYDLLGQSYEGVSVSGIKYDPETNEAILSGTAHSRDHLLGFKKTLEDLNQYKYINIPLSSLEQELDVRFRILVSLDPA